MKVNTGNMKSIIKDGVQEELDKERRRMNIIVRNCKEEIGKDDKDAVEDIFNDIGVVTEQDFQVQRLGNQHGDVNYARPIRVQFQNTQIRYKVLQKAINLKDSTINEYQKVYITPDLTKYEQEVNWLEHFLNVHHVVDHLIPDNVKQ